MDTYSSYFTLYGVWQAGLEENGRPLYGQEAYDAWLETGGIMVVEPHMVEVHEYYGE
jgi:hypothetical protein